MENMENFKDFKNNKFVNMFIKRIDKDGKILEKLEKVFQEKPEVYQKLKPILERFEKR